MNILAHQNSRVESLKTQIENLKCAHPKQKIRLKIASNNSKMYKKQCTRCGELLGEWIPHHKIKDKSNIELIDESLIENYRQSCYELKIALQEQIKKVEKEDFFEWYSEYLKSPEWRRKRHSVLKRCNHICEGCGNKEAIEVHHLTYANVGREFLFELVGLCVDCHEIIHKDSSDD